MSENINENVVAETSTTGKKSTSTAKDLAKDKEIEELKSQVASLTALLAKVLENNTSSNNTTPTSKDDVTLVYMSESLGYIEAGNVKLNCTKFRESFTLNRYDFDAVVGKYRSWFDNGVLAVSAKDYQVAEAKGLRTEDSYFLTKEIMESIATCSASKLEDIWKKADTVEQRKSICEYYKAHFIDGDEKFRNREKVELLNRLTDGGFKREVKEMSGDLLIQPIEMN